MTEPALTQLPEPHDRSHIGPRLRIERERRGLSLRELARRIGVSASLISQIEREKVNPSVSTLYALARELRLGMGDLFSTDGAPPVGPFVAEEAVASPHVTPEQRALITLASGVTWERLTAAADAAVEFLRIVYDVGSESCPDDSLMRHAGKEYGYVVAGRLGVQVGFERYELGLGDSISFDSSSPHRLWTIGNQPAEAIWVVAGRQSDGRVQRSPGGS